MIRSIRTRMPTFTLIEAFIAVIFALILTSFFWPVVTGKPLPANYEQLQVRCIDGKKFVQSEHTLRTNGSLVQIIGDDGKPEKCN